MENTFKLTSPSSLIDPGQDGKVEIRFTPQKPGLFETELTLVTNDPDYRFIKVKLRGLGGAVTSPEDYPTDDAGALDAGAPAAAAPNTNLDSGCGCHTAGGNPGEPASVLALLGLAGVALLHRRRHQS